MSTINRGSLAAAIALALGMNHAEATTFNVANANDSGAGSLRQALIDAAGDSNIPHTINLSAIAGQTINISSRLIMDPGLQDMDLTIVGSNVTVAGDGTSGVLGFGNYGLDRGNGGGYYALDVAISDLTITGGDTTEPGSGIIFEGTGKYDGSLTLDNVTVSGNNSESYGGGVAAYGGNLTITNSTITGNNGVIGGGVFHVGGELQLSNSSITNNEAAYSDNGPQRWGLMERISERGISPGGLAGGLLSVVGTRSEIVGSTISGNVSDGGAGGLATGSKYAGDVEVRDSEISGNSASNFAGGGYLGSYYGDILVAASTIANNSAGYVGGLAAGSYAGSIAINNSTVSGNSATADGGLAAFSGYGQIAVNFSTIVNNSASFGIGGAMLNSGYGYIYDGEGTSGTIGPVSQANTSIISGNFSDGQPSDLGSSSGVRPTGNDQLLSAFPLLGRMIAPEGVPIGSSIAVNHTLLGASSPSLDLDATSSDLLGQNPLLGPLADNGGPTLTHLPGAGSPVLNVVAAGDFGCGTTFTSDQRGLVRQVDGACDLGSSEIQGTAPPMPAPLAVPIGNRIGLMLMAGLLGLAGLIGMRRRRNPLA